LESGFARPGRAETGWLNRALTSLEPDDRVRAGTNRARAFAVGPITPLVVRGPAPVLSWAPQRLPPVSDDTTMRLLELYRHTDPTLARVLEDRIDLATLRSGDPQDRGKDDKGPVIQVGGIDQVRAYFADAAGAAAQFLANPDGPRVGALALDGWDTHNNEGAVNGRLSRLLGALDAALAAIETNMGNAWNETVVTLITEFGRTARINGTEGTDHGTATVALLVGGALKGGRVITDWPGVKESNLFENRDLRATTDLRAVFKGLLRDHLRVEARALMTDVFPGSESVKPIEGCLG
jgi:uncharacterized protein (DUF1501 family)